MKSIYLLVWLLAYPTSVVAQTYNLRGSAAAIGNDCYRLTGTGQFQSGNVWYTNKINLTEHFDIEFLMNFGANDADGADGMAFIMQTVGNTASGANGGGLGFGGFSPSLGIEFDTFENNSAQYGFQGDPAYDHIAVISNGSANHNDPTSLSPPVQTLVNSPNIEDGKDHQVRIIWEPSTKVLAVYVDCQLRVRLVKDLINGIFKGQSSVWWGFSGATGLYTNNQTVCLAKQILFNSLYTVCAGSSTVLTGRLSTDNVYQWSPTTGLDNPLIRTPTASPKQTTTYVVAYKNNCGLTVHDTIQVIVPDAVKTLGKDTTLCQGTVLVLRPTLPNAVYQWQDGSSQSQYTVDNPGTYSVTVTASGCNSNASIQIRYIDKTAIKLGRDTLLCEGATLLLKSALAGVHYQWQDGSQEPSYTVSTSGVYSISVTQNGCVGTDAIRVGYVKRLINPLGPDTTLCEGQSLTIRLFPLPDQVNWQDGATGPAYTIKQPGLFWAKIRSQGCLTVDSLLISSKPTFTFRVGSDTTICSEKSFLINRPTTTDSLVHFSWMDGTQGPSILVDSERYVWLESNLGGCIFRDSLRVRVTPCSDVIILVPDAFTPNNDGTNDTFGPTLKGSPLLSYSFTIYSRWGNVVFATNDQQQRWDGTYKVEACISGHYAYKVSIAYLNQNVVKRYDKLGAVLLVR
ncbi:MAG: T9SS type B sorting domain-containing protein [Cytophagaceae bacterium]|nr:MAG: T9SS type B sorting domain-containing protein [Cytophagaceae bacterium]